MNIKLLSLALNKYVCILRMRERVYITPPKGSGHGLHYELR